MIKPSTASKEHLPVIKKASGKHIWDIDGKKYLDFTGSNLTVTIGHKKYRFKNTPNFPGKSYLEDEVSKQLSKYTGTKYFRYFKNGSDAVSCSIRLARNILNKPDAVVCYVGYGGSHNEYARTVNSKGIPYTPSAQLQMGFGMTRFEGLDYAPENIDILIFESRFPGVAEFKADIKICDHLKSGINGLWEDVNADFHLYGKSLANGYPVAVMTGKNKYMKRIDEIYYSTTFGGDNIGLEAIKQTLKKYDRKKWLKLKEYADSVLPPWQSLDENKIKQFTKNGVLFNGYWAIFQSHTKEDIDRLASLCKKIL